MRVCSFENSLLHYCAPCILGTIQLVFYALPSPAEYIALTNSFTDTVISSFPNRYGRNPGDPSSVSHRIQSRLKQVQKGEIKNAYDLGLLIVDECSSSIFQPRRGVYDQKPDVLGIFQNAAIRLVSGDVHSQFSYANCI
jgi:hypothetical protein